MTEIEKLRSKGVPITLTDGRTVNLHFGTYAMMRIEEDFGSVGAMLESIGAGELPENPTEEQLDEFTKRSMRKPIFSVIAKIIAAGLSEIDEFDAMSNRQIAILLDGEQQQEYTNAIGAALEQAFPREAQEKNGSATTAFPGPTTTGSAPSASGAASTNSGV